MQEITPFLWFDSQAEEAMNFYTSVFQNSRIVSVSRYGEAGPGLEGTVMTATFQLAGREFAALNGGPEFSFTPATSFFVTCETPQQIDALWKQLSQGGSVLMELDQYPFSQKFGWVADRFGVSWQLSLVGTAQRITPFLMFVGEQHGKAEEAIRFYTSLFENSRLDAIERYGVGESDPDGTVKHARFVLDGQEFMAMDSSYEHAFTFTPAISFFVDCANQQQVDFLWDKLSEGGEVEQCGWLKDRFGLSWQIIPSVLIEMLQDKDAGKSRRVMEAMLKMTKIDIPTLRQAYDTA